MIEHECENCGHPWKSVMERSDCPCCGAIDDITEKEEN